MASTMDAEFKEILQGPIMKALARNEEGGILWFHEYSSLARDAGQGKTTPVEPDAKRPGEVGFRREVFDIVKGRPSLTVRVLFKETKNFNVWIEAQQYDFGAWNIKVPYVTSAEVIERSGWFGRIFQAQVESEALRQAITDAEAALEAARRG